MKQIKSQNASTVNPALVTTSCKQLLV